MPVVNWIYCDPDPVASGELRRLGIAALALEGGAWSCRMVRADAISAQGPADITVVPVGAFVSATAVLNNPAVRLVVEIDDGSAADPSALAALTSGLGRVSAVVVRGEAARRALAAAAPQVQPLYAPDVADTWPELAAAALRFGFVLPAREQNPPLSGATQLWFAEPGDRVDPGEVAELERAWRTPPHGGVRAAVADPATLEWLAQSGVATDLTDSGPAAVASLLHRGVHCLLPGRAEGSILRRRRKAQRHGVHLLGGAAPDGRGCDPKAVGAAWRAALSPLLESRSAASASPVEVLVFLDLVQDLDLALPILDELARRPAVTIRMVVSTWLEERSPRVTAELSARGLSPERFTRAAIVQGAGPDLRGVDAVVCIVETSDPAHARAHALVKRAQQHGIATFSLQHGLENIGLNMFPAAAEDTVILSDHVLVWFAQENTPAATPEVLRPRLVHVGRPRQEPHGAEVRAIFDGFARVAAVFENLHWDRYNQAFRRRFIDDCVDFAIAFPDTAVLLKPHHAGMWTARNRGQFSQWSQNLVLADPSDPLWEPFTAPSLISAADLVITTPSTVALDAALARKPVAVAAYGMDLPAFEPLPMLQGGSDWIEFGRSASAVAGALERARFVSRATTGKRPEADAVTFLLTVAREGRRRPSVGEGRGRSGAEAVA